MKIYVDKAYITPDLINQVPGDIKEKLKNLFFTEENIDKLKSRSENKAYKAIVFDSSPEDPMFFMVATDLEFDEEQEDNRGILQYTPQSQKDISHSLIMLLSENDFNIADSDFID